MSDPTMQPKPKKRYGEIIGVFVLLGVIILAALYQEQLTSFFTLRLWDKGAPAKQVTAFLTALQKGDQAAASAIFEPNTSYKPLMEKDKWNGYFIITQAGKLIFTLAETAPKEEPKDLKVEFNPNGKGSAMVTAPDGRGKMVDYRMEMIEGQWRITEMRGGRPESTAPAKTVRQTPPPMPGGGGGAKKPSGKPTH